MPPKKIPSKNMATSEPSIIKEEKATGKRVSFANSTKTDIPDDVVDRTVDRILRSMDAQAAKNQPIQRAEKRTKISNDSPLEEEILELEDRIVSLNSALVYAGASPDMLESLEKDIRRAERKLAKLIKASKNPSAASEHPAQDDCATSEYCSAAVTPNSPLEVIHQFAPPVTAAIANVTGVVDMDVVEEYWTRILDYPSCI